MSNLTYDDPKASRLPVAALTARVTTLVTLAVSMGILKSISVTYQLGFDRVIMNKNDVYTYQYVFFGMVAGFCYTLLQVPFALYFFFTKKRLINNNAFLEFEFYGDKICLTLLGTIVGALFGATVETKRNGDGLGSIGDVTDLSDYYSKLREFCMMVYISGSILLVGFVCSMVSSIMSSRALTNKS